MVDFNFGKKMFYHGQLNNYNTIFVLKCKDLK